MKIAFYLNLQGLGHCRRFELVARHLPADCQLAVVGMDKIAPIADIGRPVKRVSVPGFGARSNNPFLQKQTAYNYHGLLVNQGENARFTLSMVTFLSEWKPDLLVVDVGLEAAVLARMCGIPVLYARQHGQRWDKGHTLAYEWACSLWAPFATTLEQDDCPLWIRNKTFYSGGFSRFTGQPKAQRPPNTFGQRQGDVVVMVGMGGTEITLSAIAKTAASLPQYQWHVLGINALPDGTHRSMTLPSNLFCQGMVADVWPYLSWATAVVSNAGHNSVMEIDAAAVPFICMPAFRPFEEQHCKATVLARLNRCIAVEHWPTSVEWPDLLQRAIAQQRQSQRSPLQESGASLRAAEYIHQIAQLCMGSGAQIQRNNSFTSAMSDIQDSSESSPLRV
jgi:UDP-N-acetylglucosamine--N-acetylmuramyl-(pentapeptide) pyrophosphoryl-undecaprenol N-acetylglucosamine transferase